MSYCQRCADLEHENEELRRHLERRAAGTDPLAQHLREKAEALLAENERLRNALAALTHA